jgi:hypothetical protein
MNQDSNGTLRLSKYKLRNKEKLKLWANQETFSEEQFTPLHIAAFNGST